MIASIDGLYMNNMYKAALFNLSCIVVGCLGALAAVAFGKGIVSP